MARHNSSPRVVVLGLGRFGASLALELMRRGSEVLGVDSKGRVVQRFADRPTHAAVADTTDAEALRQLDVPDYDRAVVGIGDDLVTGRMMDYIEFEDDFAMVKTTAPDDIVGRPPSDTAVRTRDHITVVGVKRPGDDFTYATQDTVVQTGDLLIVSGRIDDVEAFAERA